MMFLNAQKPGLIKDPYIYKPDSIMLDLEDAVAENQKDATSSQNQWSGFPLLERRYPLCSCRWL